MRYQKPSIVEALCEFAFEPSQPWDWTVFGQFASAFPELSVREQAEVMAIDLKGDAQSMSQKVRREPRMRFFRGDRTRLAQVGENLLAANVLSPYPHWNEFRTFILQALEAYKQAALPAAIQRAMLRYIDRIEPEPGPVRLGDWLATDSPYVPAFLSDAQAPAQSRVQKQVESGVETVSVQLQVEQGGKAFIMLDTEVVRVEMGLEPDAVAVELDALHARIIEVFESTISERTRTLLQPQQE